MNIKFKRSLPSQRLKCFLAIKLSRFAQTKPCPRCARNLWTDANDTNPEHRSMANHQSIHPCSELCTDRSFLLVNKRHLRHTSRCTKVRKVRGVKRSTVSFLWRGSYWIQGELESYTRFRGTQVGPRDGRFLEASESRRWCRLDGQAIELTTICDKAKIESMTTHTTRDREKEFRNALLVRHPQCIVSQLSVLRLLSASRLIPRCLGDPWSPVYFQRFTGLPTLVTTYHQSTGVAVNLLVADLINTFGILKHGNCKSPFLRN